MPDSIAQKILCCYEAGKCSASRTAVPSLLPFVSPVECGHRAIGFTFDDLLFEVVPLVDGRFSSAYSELDLHTAVLPVEPECNKRLALHSSGGK